MKQIDEDNCLTQLVHSWLHVSSTRFYLAVGVLIRNANQHWRTYFSNESNCRSVRRIHSQDIQPSCTIPYAKERHCQSVKDFWDCGCCVELWGGGQCLSGKWEQRHFRVNFQLYQVSVLKARPVLDQLRVREERPRDQTTIRVSSTDAEPTSKNFLRRAPIGGTDVRPSSKRNLTEEAN